MISVFKDSFLQTALVASLVVGAVCAYLGVYVVLRRIVFVGAALAQVSSAGVGLALLYRQGPVAGVAAAHSWRGSRVFSQNQRPPHHPGELHRDRVCRRERSGGAVSSRRALRARGTCSTCFRAIS